MQLFVSEKPKPRLDGISAAALAFDPFDPDYTRDPYATLTAMRDSEPVFYAPSIDTWMVMKHATIGAILRDPKRFSASVASDALTPLCADAAGIISGSEFDVPGLLVNNGSPSHPRCRRFFGEPLRPDRIQSLRPFIEETVDRYIDDMIEQGPPSDLAAVITWDVPALVLFRLIGIPDKDIDLVKDYAESRVALLWGRPKPEDQIRATQGALEFFRYTTRLVQDRLADPRDDYPSDLIRMRDGDDEKASVREIIAVTFNLLFAGHETTSSAAANMLSAVLHRPHIWSGITEGHIPVAKVVEEALRFDPPVQAWRRQATEDVEVEGVSIPAGSHLLLVFASGNRDPARFTQPDDFDPERPNAQQHLTFGQGSHFCLGAPLARIELATILERLAARVPSLRLAGESLPNYLPNTSFRGLRQLKATW